MRTLLSLLVGVCLLGVACNRGADIAGPSEPAAAPAAPAQLPGQLYGAFAASDDVPEAAANAGNVVLVVPSYQDDAQLVAAALRANGKVAILSAHHVFGNSPATWPAGWQQTRAWAEPFADRIVAVMVVDEPLLNGIPASARDEAIALVRRDGYRTMTTEWAEYAVRSSRPPADLFAVTCYAWPGEGSWSMDRCEEAYRSHPEWNLAIGQGFDIYEGGRGNCSVADQFRRWAAIGRARGGVIWWVWRWPGQMGIGDQPDYRAAFNEGWR